MASTQALPSDVHATTVEQVEKDKEDIPLSKEDDKKTVIEETPEVPELAAATITSDDKQPESVIGTEGEKEAPIVAAPVEVDSKEVDISAPKTEQEPEPVSIKEEEKPVIEVKEKEVATEVHEVAKSEAEKPATEAVAEAIEDKAEKATSEVVAPEPVIEATTENVEAVVEHEEKPTAEAVEDVPVVEAKEKPAAEVVQDPEPDIKNLAELVTPEPVTIEGHVEAVVEQEEKPIPEVVEDVPAVVSKEKPAAEAVQDSEPEIKNLAEHVTQEPVAIEGHVEAVAEHEEKQVAEVVEDVPTEKNVAEVKEESTTVKKLAEQVPQEPVAIEGQVEAVAVQEEKPTAELVEAAPSEKNGAEVKEEPTTVTKLAEQVTQAVDEVKPDAPTEEAKNGDDGTVTSSRDMATEEVVVKTKQSSNIMSKVKQSLVKVKKAIIGKSPSSKALSAETKVEVKAK